jgi:hypothetical protein
LPLDDKLVSGEILSIMSIWDIGPSHAPPALSRDQAIEIALSDPLISPELRALPVQAEYGSSLPGRTDVWKVAVDVSSLGWVMEYEGPDPTMIGGEMRYPQHVRVPNVRAVIVIVDDKTGRRVCSGTEPDPAGEHRIEWRKAEEFDPSAPRHFRHHQAEVQEIYDVLRREQPHGDWVKLWTEALSLFRVRYETRILPPEDPDQPA